MVLTSLQYVVFLLFVGRWTVKPLLALLILVAAAVSYFASNYGTYFDTDMLANMLQTDTQEAGELMTGRFMLHIVVFAVLPILLLSRVRIPAVSWRRALLRRMSCLSFSTIVLVASVFLTYQHLSPLMRNQPELRYLVTPGNTLVSMERVLAASDRVPSQERLPLESDASIAADDYPALCRDGRCFDAALAEELKHRVEQSTGDTVIVLHELGNYGPSCYQRYPDAFRRFTPICESADLSQCARQAIVNSYDNAILYNDQMLSDMIDFLGRQQRFAASMIYLSDHGKSLGENGLYLHDLSYAIAPGEQTQVPMIWWLSDEIQRRTGIDSDCLKANAGQPHSQANLFHTALGILEVTTTAYRPALDLGHSCR